MRRFNVTWWAYSFPITVLAIAATEYAEEVKGKLADVLMLVLASLSMLVTFSLVILTLLFNSKMLLPDNDPFVSSSAVTPVPHHLPTINTRTTPLDIGRNY
uniref:Uncharacterized protein n=1 Tax=Chenopodium quinoa TaxID=63459 RepID=A0A803MSK6_CHEQI